MNVSLAEREPVCATRESIYVSTEELLLAMNHSNLGKRSSVIRDSKPPFVMLSGRKLLFSEVCLTNSS
ncbi:hypothetical protein OFM36_38420, partial [Escherichia coli]|nr:hypothetical protein [Escherichia coli]